MVAQKYATFSWRGLVRLESATVVAAVERAGMSGKRY
jgi:hypothetical protein